MTIDWCPGLSTITIVEITSSFPFRWPFVGLNSRQQIGVLSNVQRCILLIEGAFHKEVNFFLNQCFTVRRRRISELCTYDVSAQSPSALLV